MNRHEAFMKESDIKIHISKYIYSFEVGWLIITLKVYFEPLTGPLFVISQMSTLDCVTCVK